MNKTERRKWSIEELAEIAKGHFPIPDIKRGFHQLDLYIYPQWCLFFGSHLLQKISLEEIEGNIPYIAMLNHERALDINIDELIDIGYIVHKEEENDPRN